MPEKNKGKHNYEGRMTPRQLRWVKTHWLLSDWEKMGLYMLGDLDEMPEVDDG